MPYPKPKTDKYTPDFLLSTINSSIFLSEEAPTLKSPSVAKITLLFPFFLKFISASLYANSIPLPPAVAPPALRLFKALKIVSFLSPEVGSNTTLAVPA